jgi:hypothetical protein
MNVGISPSQIDIPKFEFDEYAAMLVKIEVALKHSFLHWVHSHAPRWHAINRLWHGRD